MDNLITGHPMGPVDAAYDLSDPAQGAEALARQLEDEVEEFLASLNTKENERWQS